LCDAEPCTDHLIANVDTTPDDNVTTTTTDDAVTAGDQTACEESCDFLLNFSCVEVSTYDWCYDHCSVAAADQARFVSCQQAAPICNGTDCLHHLDIEDTASADPSDVVAGDDGAVASCKSICDELQSAGCLVSGELSTCRNACENADNFDLGDFESCVEDAVECQGAASCISEIDPNFVLWVPTPEETCLMACEGLQASGCVTAAEAISCSASCEGAHEDAITRFAVCAATSAECHETHDCLAGFDANFEGRAEVGESCTYASDCTIPDFPEDSACVSVRGSASFCTWTCDYNEASCPGGTFCEELDFATSVCVPAEI